MRHLKLGKVYPITASNNLNGLDHVQLVEQYLKGGTRFLQVREPTLPDSLLYPQLLKIRSLCEPLGAQFLINDRVDLAQAGGIGEVLPELRQRLVLGFGVLIGDVLPAPYDLQSLEDRLGRCSGGEQCVARRVAFVLG